jgi:hypothetical protein
MFLTHFKLLVSSSQNLHYSAMKVASKKINDSSMFQCQKPQAAMGMKLPEVSSKLENKTPICITRFCANNLHCKNGRSCHK